MMKFGRIKNIIALSFLFALFTQPVLAVDVKGVKIEDAMKVGGKDLKLNGAGMRVKAIFSVYAAGLYLTEKKTAVPDVLALEGPKRMVLVMQREVSSEDFGQSFMTGLNDNSDKAEKSKIINQTVKFGEMFASLPGLKKGDVLYLDWIPGSGTVSSLNGKQMGETIPDAAFYNAVLRLWLGPKPVDSSLKPLLLGGK
jgi:hypothetical protein